MSLGKLFSGALFFIILNASQVFAGPVIVGSGGGASEYSIIFARSSFAKMLEECAISCELSAVDQQVLLQLQKITGLPAAIFKNQKDLGSRVYEIHGQEVWINQDLLWLDADHSIPYDVAEAVALWLEIAEQVSGQPAAASSIQEKARILFRKQIQRGNIELAKDQVFEFILWKSSSEDHLVARDPFMQTLEVSGAAKEIIDCEERDSRQQFFSPTWLPMESQNDIVLNLNFGVKWTCGGKTQSSFGRGIVLTKSDKNGNWKFAASTFYVHIDGVQ